MLKGENNMKRKTKVLMLGLLAFMLAPIIALTVGCRSNNDTPDTPTIDGITLTGIFDEQDSLYAYLGTTINATAETTGETGTITFTWYIYQNDAAILTGTDFEPETIGKFTVRATSSLVEVVDYEVNFTVIEQPPIEGPDDEPEDCPSEEPDDEPTDNPIEFELTGLTAGPGDQGYVGRIGEELIANATHTSKHAISFIWERYVALEDDYKWEEVATGGAFTPNTSGKFRVTSYMQETLVYYVFEFTVLGNISAVAVSYDRYVGEELTASATHPDGGLLDFIWQHYIDGEWVQVAIGTTFIPTQQGQYRIIVSAQDAFASYTTITVFA